MLPEEIEDQVISYEELDKLNDDQALEILDDPDGYQNDQAELNQVIDTDPPERDPETDTLAATDTEEGEEGEIVEFENPFAEDGIPDDMLINPKTGEPYDNGLILGRYDSADKFYEGVRELDSFRGKRTEEIRSELEAELDTGEMGYLDDAPAPLELSEEQEQEIHSWSMSRAAQHYEKEFMEKGLEVPQTAEDWSDLSDADPALYAKLSLRAEFEETKGKNFLYGHLQAQQNAEVLNEEAIIDGYQSFENEMIRITGIEPDEEDRAMLVDIYNKNIEALQDNPDPRYFNDNYGVPVLNPKAILDYNLLSERERIADIVRNAAMNSAVLDYEQQMAERMKDAGNELPVMLGAETEDGVSGRVVGIMTEEQLMAPDILDRLTAQFGGDEDKAMAEYERQLQVYDEHYQNAGKVFSDKSQF